MGYRTYIAEMSKDEYNYIKNMTGEHLRKFYKIKLDEDKYWYKGVYEFGKSLYEFGKYTDFKPPAKSMSPFFKNKALMKRYDEHDFFVVTREFLAYLINLYKEKVKAYYNEIVMPFLGDKDKPSEFLNSIKTEYNYPDNKHTFDFSKITSEEQTALFKVIEHIRSFRTEWVQLTPFNLENGDAVTTSWKYEYGIFEMVRIYKSFDWKNKTMFYYGY
jgi:hypothetical protein